MLVVFLVVCPLLSRGLPVREESNRWETEEHQGVMGVLDRRGQREAERSGYGLKVTDREDIMGVLDRRDMDDETESEDRWTEPDVGPGIAQVEIGEDGENVYILLPKLRAEHEEKEEGPLFEEKEEEEEEILENNAIRLIGLLNRRDLMSTDSPSEEGSRNDDIWRIGENEEESGTISEFTEEGEDESDHVEIGEDDGKIYILLPKLKGDEDSLRGDEDLLNELGELDGPLFGEGVSVMRQDDLEQKTIRLLHEALESRIYAEDNRERLEDEREEREDEREELWKRSNQIEIDEGVDSYRILMPKQEKLGRIKLGNWVARGARDKEVKIKGQGDGRGGHTIYRSDHGDFAEVNMF